MRAVFGATLLICSLFGGLSHSSVDTDVNPSPYLTTSIPTSNPLLNPSLNAILNPTLNPVLIPTSNPACNFDKSKWTLYSTDFCRCPHKMGILELSGDQVVINTMLNLCLALGVEREEIGLSLPKNCTSNCDDCIPTVNHHNDTLQNNTSNSGGDIQSASSRTSSGMNPTLSMALFPSIAFVLLIVVISVVAARRQMSTIQKKPTDSYMVNPMDDFMSTQTRKGMSLQMDMINSGSMIAGQSLLNSTLAGVPSLAVLRDDDSSQLMRLKTIRRPSQSALRSPTNASF